MFLFYIDMVSWKCKISKPDVLMNPKTIFTHLGSQKKRCICMCIWCICTWVLCYGECTYLLWLNFKRINFMYGNCELLRWYSDTSMLCITRFSTAAQLWPWTHTRTHRWNTPFSFFQPLISMQIATMPFHGVIVIIHKCLSHFYSLRSVCVCVLVYASNSFLACVHQRKYMCVWANVSPFWNLFL